jgi:hypothetical protein
MIVLTLLLISTLSAHAQLGEPESSIEQLQRATRTTRRAATRVTTTHAAYTVHVLEKNGMTIREYVNSDKKVFAITYRGYRSPEPKTILGKFISEYQNLERDQRRAPGARNQLLASSKLIAARSGHPRALRGRFIARDLVPSGVDIHALQ